MTAQTRSIRMFRTHAHPCGYYADRVSSNLILDPEDPELARVFERALECGFRRAGDRLYRPSCPQCQACIPARIAATNFQPRRRHRRVLEANSDLRIESTTASESPAHRALYARYLAQRHSDGGMDGNDPEAFSRFLLSSWADTRFLNHYLGDQLIACAVTDCTPSALSAIYTFFDAGMTERSLGTLAILSQIKYARQTGRDYVYLGFWINGHPKMDYKRHYPALELRDMNGAWIPAEEYFAEPVVSD